MIYLLLLFQQPTPPPVQTSPDPGNITLLFWGAGIAIVTAIITSLVQHILTLRVEKTKFERDQEAKKIDFEREQEAEKIKWEREQKLELDRRMQEGALSKANLKGYDLQDHYLPEADLTKANLTGANLARANLEGANLTRATLEGANLTKVRLKGANLERAILIKADLTGADLSGASLHGADLRGANLHGAKLYDVDLPNALFMGDVYRAQTNLDRAYYDDHTEWPDGFNPMAAGATKVD